MSQKIVVTSRRPVAAGSPVVTERPQPMQKRAVPGFGVPHREHVAGADVMPGKVSAAGGP
jgi:hypothetical protein